MLQSSIIVHRALSLICLLCMPLWSLTRAIGRPSLSWNPEYANNCTNPHMSLSPGTSCSNENSPIYLMRNAKRKKKRSPVRLGMIFRSLPPLFHRKWRDELMYFLNPASGLTGLEPAASALTGRCSDRLNYNPRCTASTFFFSSFELLTFAVL